MSAFLLDADAVIHLHSLGLIDALAEALQAGRITLHCTNYVWAHELTHLLPVRERLVAAGLQVHILSLKSPAGQTFRELLRERGNPGRNSKGENELVAFAANSELNLTLVAHDEGARSLARTKGVSAIDLAEFLCELVCLDAVDEGRVKESLAPWDNPHAGNGRPKSYQGFTKTLEVWRRRRPP